MNPTVRKCICPVKDYPKFKQDLESNGYVILSAEPGEGEAVDTIVFEYEKVQRIARSAFKPSQDGWL